MKRQYLKSEANRCLVQWARNMRKGYGMLGCKSMSFDDYVYSSSPLIDDYTDEESLCLSEMAKIAEGDTDLYLLADLEYIKQSEWIGDCVHRGGWWDGEGIHFHVVAKATRADFIKMVSIKYGVGKSEYYRRLKALQKRVFDNVVMV